MNNLLYNIHNKSSSIYEKRLQKQNDFLSVLEIIELKILVTRRNAFFFVFLIVKNVQNNENLKDCTTSFFTFSFEFRVSKILL